MTGAGKAGLPPSPPLAGDPALVRPADTLRIDLPLEDASPEALEPFGQLIGRGSRAVKVPVDFYAGRVRMSYPARFRCDHPVEISLARIDRRPGEVRYLERHFQHTQVFLPLGGRPFIAVMAPPSEDDLPDPAQVRAFRFDGQAGFAMHVGTWHEFPFAIEDETDLVVILSSQTGADLRNKDVETEEAQGPDLDKKDILARTGRLFRFDLPPSTS